MITIKFDDPNLVENVKAISELQKAGYLRQSYPGFLRSRLQKGQGG